MTARAAGWLRAYAAALRLYPKPFRQEYAPAMLQCFRDALAGDALPSRRLIPLVLRDLVVSLAKEHIAMLREAYGRPALVYNFLVLSALATGLALALYAIPQQVLRQGLNDPQIAMATDLAAALEKGGLTEMLQQGALPAIAGGSARVDMARSLSPFVIVYDDQGRPLASQAVLNGETPAPPAGVFENVRQHGEARLSWQPILGREHGVRIAAVIERVRGAQPGFVLAGRNMREVEAREEQVRQMAGLTWIGMLGVILVGTAAFGWYTRPRAEA
ncbi:MAG: hypothetical protein WCE75_02700 [Terracidiphilus sp.]